MSHVLTLCQRADLLKLRRAGGEKTTHFLTRFPQIMTSLKITGKSFLPSFVKQPTEAKVLESFVETVYSPELDIGDEPFNEFGIANLAIAFSHSFS